MDWGRAPANGFDETTHTLCWDRLKIRDSNVESLVRLLREHAGGSLRHLHVRCGCLLPYLLQLIQLFVNSNVLDSQRYPDHA